MARRSDSPDASLVASNGARISARIIGDEVVEVLVEYGDSATTALLPNDGGGGIEGTARGEDSWCWLFFGRTRGASAVEIDTDAECTALIDVGKESWVAEVAAPEPQKRSRGVSHAGRIRGVRDEELLWEERFSFVARRPRQ